MKKIILSFFILLLSGCWNYKELSNYSIVTQMAIDKTNDNNYLISFLVSNDKQNDTNNQYQSTIYSSEGNTIYEAIKNIELISPKPIYLGHLNVLIISEKVAKIGINNLFEYFINNSISMKNFSVILSKGTDAKNILNKTSIIENTTNQYLFNKFISSNKYPNVQTFNDIVFELYNNGIDSSISSYSIENEIIKFDTIGIFKNDKLVSWTNEEENMGIYILNNNLTNFYLNIDLDSCYALVNINKLHTKKQISKNNIDIQIIGASNVKETNCINNIINNNLKYKIEEKLNEITYNSISLARNYESDIFGFGLQLYRNHPNEFDIINWYDNFKNININIKSNITINNNLERINNE